MMTGQRPPGLPESVFVHGLALVDSPDVGEGTRVWGFSHVLKGAKIGSKCNICEHVYIEGGAVVGNEVTIKNGISIWDRVLIEDQVFLGPHMVFTNDLKPRAFIKLGHEQLLPTVVKKGATIGAGAVIVCGTTIGEYSFVAAGAVVTKDVPAYGVVKGNPARLSSYVCKCTETFFALDRKSGASSCDKCGTKHPLG